MPPSTLPPSRSARDSRAWVDAWERSGLSARAFAEQHGLVAGTLYGWRRQLRCAAATTDPAPAPRLLPVTLEVPTLCEVHLRDGRVLRFPATVAPTVLRALVHALETP